NAAGAFVQPDEAAFAAAAANARWNPASAFYEILTNEPGAKSWPVTGATFVLMYKNAADKQKSATVLHFFEWAFQEGKQDALKLEFVPLPASVVNVVKTSWKTTVATEQKN